MRMKVTFSDEEQAAIDALRGQVPAATWVRGLVRQAGVAAQVLDEARAGSAEDPGEVSAAVGVPEPHRAPAVVPVVPAVEEPRPMTRLEEDMADRDRQIAAADAYSRAHRRSG